MRASQEAGIPEAKGWILGSSAKWVLTATTKHCKRPAHTVAVVQLPPVVQVLKLVPWQQTPAPTLDCTPITWSPTSAGPSMLPFFSHALSVPGGCNLLHHRHTNSRHHQCCSALHSRTLSSPPAVLRCLCCYLIGTDPMYITRTSISLTSSW